MSVIGTVNESVHATLGEMHTDFASNLPLSRKDSVTEPLSRSMDAVANFERQIDLAIPQTVKNLVVRILMHILNTSLAPPPPPQQTAPTHIPPPTPLEISSHIYCINALFHILDTSLNIIVNTVEHATAPPPQYPQS